MGLGSGGIGFIYRINYTCGKKYIGKKLIRSVVKLKATKAQLAIRKNYVRRELKNKPFAKYEGSSEITDDYIIESKEIIELCSTKIDLTYCETKWLFRVDALFNEEYLNGCIGGAFFKNKIKKGL